MRAYQRSGRLPCTVEGCSQPLYCRGYCTTHYTRLLRTGDLRGAARERGQWGSGSVNGDGYRVGHDAAHPLATAQGKLLAHRSALYEVLGGGLHPCHWCGKRLTWRGAAESRICVDHLNDDRLDNDPANLVAACLDCNTKRGATA